MVGRPRWVRFDPVGGPFPPERRLVLVAVAARDHLPPAVAVGYWRYWSVPCEHPDLAQGFFVIPGMGGPKFTPTYWADCLGNEFFGPEWPGTDRGGNGLRPGEWREDDQPRREDNG